MEPFDPTKPNIARVWDYWLGGNDNFAADRALAEKMLAVHPPTEQMARENRRFLGRAVSYLTSRGIRQFIDVGAGFGVTDELTGQSYRWGAADYVRLDPAVAPAHIFTVTA